MISNSRKRLVVGAVAWMAAVLAAMAQMANPVHFTSQLAMLGDGEAELVFAATIDPGWHVYSTSLGQDGPIEASLHVEKMEGAELVGRLMPRGKEVKQYDQMFGMELRFFEDRGAFVQKIRFTKPQYDISCYLEYGACSNEMCLPPTQVEFKETGKVRLTEQKNSTSPSQEPNTDSSQEPTPTPSQGEGSSDSISAGETISDNSKTTTNIAPLPLGGVGGGLGGGIGAGPSDGMGLGLTFWFGLLGGLLAILTPCVWPIIPMTVSFFLKRNKERRRAVGEALAYGASIVVIYVLLGLAVTLIFGASALNALSTNAVFNIFFALLLIVFAASFFGAFELTLPSSWSNKIDQKSESTTGLLSIFLMAFTLVLVSFSCTGPIIGFLLVAVSTQGSILAPTVGMLGFAIALAVPFTLFALFPSLLKSAPRSGEWMNTVKVVLGFIELAFALKFLSVADLAYGWHLLDREVFLSLWIVLFALLGVYLLKRGGIIPFFLALFSLSFSVYMLPGLWGAPLKAISAFAPPMSTQDFSLYQGSVEARYKDFELGMQAARAEGKPVMVDFTGYGCVNCRKMEAAVWTDPRVRDLLNNRYVLISLFVDDKTPLPEPVEVTEQDGRRRKLRTVGDKWSYLERTLIGANTQPFYVLLDPATGKALNGLRSYDEDIDAYVRFLSEGLENHRKQQGARR